MQWLNNGVNFVSRFRTNIIVGAVILLALVVSHTAAYQIGRSHGTVTEVRREARVQERRVVEYRDRLVTQTQRITVRNIERETVLTRRNTELQRTNRQLQEQLNAVPDPQPTVYLTNRDVCLLNQAALPITGGTPSATDAACDADDPAAAPSPVTLRAFISTELDVRTIANGWREQLLGWQEFARTELLPAGDPSGGPASSGVRPP